MLLQNESDEFIQQKLQTNCLKGYVKTLYNNLDYWKITQLSLTFLAELCEQKSLVSQWIHPKESGVDQYLKQIG